VIGLAGFAVATAIVTAASALQASTGMGMALLAAPLLSLVQPSLVPGPTLCAVLALSAAVAVRERADIGRRILSVALPGLIAGSVAGAGLDKAFHALHLAPVFGVLILLAVLVTVLMYAADRRVPLRWPWLLVGGSLAGLIGTMFAAHGPPIALVLQELPRRQLRATLCAFFAIGCVISLVFLSVTGRFGMSGFIDGLLLMPGVPIGFAFAPLIDRWLARDARRANWTRYSVWIISSLSAAALLMR